MSRSSISEAVRVRVRQRASNRCGYCLAPQHLVLGWLEVEHIIPLGANGTDDEENLWLSCRLCNVYKSAQTQATDPMTGDFAQLFDPRRQLWAEHFEWSEDGIRVTGRTTIARATVLALQLNNSIAVMVRREWVRAGWHPPVDTGKKGK